MAKKNEKKESFEEKSELLNELEELRKLKEELKKQIEEINERNKRESDAVIKGIRRAGNPEQILLEELEAMPLETHQDYINYNEKVREIRRKTRKSIGKMKYCPLDKVKKIKCKLSRTDNRGLDIMINIKDLKNAVWFQGKFKDGEEVEVPAILIDRINSLSVPIYKQVKTKDGTKTVLDYYQNKYNCSVMVGNG